MLSNCFARAAGLVLFFAWTLSAHAGDWPQILGPDRNGVAAADERLATGWPEGGPATVWQRPVGEGYSGIAVAHGRAFLFHRDGDVELVEAIDAKSGELLWKQQFPTDFSSGFSDDDGPRCTPVVHEGRVYVYGAAGGLRCLDAKSGDVAWERETHRDFAAPEGYFGAGSTPVVAGKRILVNVGGARKGAGVVAFDLATGETKWQATKELASYSSPVLTTVDGVRQAIFVTRLKTLGLAPQSGNVLWEFPFGKRGPTVNAASPVVLDGHVFVSAHYGIGGVWAKVGKSSVEEVWRDDSLLSAHYTTPVAHEGKLYGIDGQERLDPGRLRCFDPRTRKVHWTVDDYGYGTLLRAGDLFLLLQTGGDVVLFRANTARYEELARAKAFDSTTRVIPALANGLLYARDRETLKCLRVGRN